MSIGQRGSIDQGDLARSFAQLLRDDLACAALLLDENGRVAAATPAATALPGCSGQSWVGQPLAQLPDYVRHALEGHRSETAEVRVRVEPLAFPDGRALRLVLIQDLVLARQLETDIRQLDRLASVGTLAAEMAHEVKNALVGIKTFADLLLEQNPQAEMAGTVRREVRRIQSIVGQVLKFSRPSPGAFEPLAIHPLLGHCLELVEPRLRSAGIALVTRFNAATDRVAGDPPNLEQALLNLLLNAEEAMPDGGTLTVETEFLAGPRAEPGQSVAERELRVTIRDTGSGIVAEDMAHLFEPFFSTKPHGTGLGLAITRRIIHEHHGLISAESGPGTGTAFHILLPAL